MQRRISDKGLQLIKDFEGFRSHPYVCSGGKWTIGYGSTRGVTANTPPITREEGERSLRVDVRFAENIVNEFARANDLALSQGQFDALTSLVFNCGSAPLRKTLGRVLRERRFDAAPAQIMRWVYAGGQRLRGLERRRRAELELWRGLDVHEPEEIEEAFGVDVEPAPAKPLTQSGTIRGGLVVGGGAGALLLENLPALTEQLAHVRSLTDVFGSISNNSSTVVAAIVLVAVGYMMWRRWRDREML